MITPRPLSSPSDQAHTIDQNQGPVPDAPVTFDFLAPPQAPEEIGRLGSYRVLGLLGTGGMGMVFRAEDPQLDREVALKVILPQFAIKPQARQRFLREARAVAAVEHLHVVPIFHVGEDHGVPYLVMPLLKGSSLAEVLKKNPRATVQELVRIGREIAEGLAAAHAQHLVHRDIKPGNIWLEGDARWVRLLDFGLARPDETAVVTEEPLTASGQVVGTPIYMSPEQANGQQVTAASDLFSLGVVLYRMATGIVPFAAPTMMAVLTALAAKHPEPPTNFAPDLPESLSQLIQDLLAKDPAKRPPSAQAVANELKQIESRLPAVTHVGGTATTVSPPAALASTVSAINQPPHRRVWLWALAGIAALSALVFLAQQQIRIETPKGTLLIDCDDPGVEIVVKKNEAVIRDKTRDREIILEVGDYTIELREAKDGLKLSPDKFSITEGGRPTIKVWLEKPPLAKESPPEPDTPALHRKVAEWFLKYEGLRRIHLEPGGWLTRGDSIPQGDVRLTSIDTFLIRLDDLPANINSWLKTIQAKRVTFQLPIANRQSQLA